MHNHIIAVSVARCLCLCVQLVQLPDDEKAKAEAEAGAPSALPKIISTGFKVRPLTVDMLSCSLYCWTKSSAACMHLNSGD